MNTIIVTGGSGYIGSAIVAIAISNGYKVINIDREQPQYKSPNGEQIWIRYDLTANPWYELIPEIKKQLGGDVPYALIHMAAYKDLPESYEVPSIYYHNNLISTINVTEIAKAIGVKCVIFSSSAGVYSDELHGSVKETDLTTGDSPYGYTKLVGERIIQDCCVESRISSFNLRYQNPIGCIDGVTEDTSTSMFGNILRAIANNERFTIYGSNYDTPDGTCIRDYIDIEDIARIHLKFVEIGAKDLINDTVNVGRGEPLSCLDVCKLVKSIHPDFSWSLGEPREGDAAGIYASTEKLKGRYGIDVQTPISHTVSKIIKRGLYYSKNKSQKD